MSKARLIITAVLLEGRTKSEVARDYDVSRYWVQQLVQRYLVEGEAAYQPRSRRPHSSPHAVPAAVEDEIVRLRKGCPGGAWTPAPTPSVATWPGARQVRARPAQRARGLDDLADPGPPRVRHPATPEATSLVVAPV